LTAKKDAFHLRPVLIFAHGWPPNAEVGAVRAVYLARQLARNGWQPIVVTLHERYYELRNTAGIAGTDSALVIRTYCLPNPRKVYLLFKKWLAWCRRRLLAITASPERLDESSSSQEERISRSPPSFFKRTLLSLLYTPDEFLGWFPFALAASLSAVARHRPQCVISTGPPYTSHLVALALKGICGTRWVADFRDPWSWSDSHLSNERIGVVADGINRWLEKIVMRSADRVVCVAHGMTEKYRTLYPALPANKWITITNGYDLDEFAGLGHVDKSDRFTISYVGGAGGYDFSRTPLLVLRAIGELIAENRLDRHKVMIRFLGPDRDTAGHSIGGMISENGLSGIAECIGLVPRPDALKEILRASAVVLLGGTQRLSVAAKLYEYLASVTPILAIVEEGDAADIIRRTNAGYVIAPNDLPGAKNAIRSLYEKYLHDRQAGAMAKPGDPAITDEYNWERLGERYAALLEECCEAK